MTIEDAYHAHVDANPTDWLARLQFADYLEEIGDPRASGYRAIGRVQRMPVRCEDGWARPGYIDSEVTNGSFAVPNVSRLPKIWILAIPDLKYGLYAGWRVRDTRREIEDAAAVAWTKLTEEEQNSIPAEL